MSGIYVNCGYCGYGADISKWWHWRCKSCPTVYCSPACFRNGKLDHDYFCHPARPPVRKPFNSGDGNTPQLTRVFENTAFKSRQATPNSSQDDPESRESSRQRSYDARPQPRRNDQSKNPNQFKPVNLQSSDDPRSRPRSYHSHQSYDARPHSNTDLNMTGSIAPNRGNQTSSKAYQKSGFGLDPNSTLPTHPRPFDNIDNVGKKKSHYEQSKTVYHEMMKQDTCPQQTKLSPESNKPKTFAKTKKDETGLKVKQEEPMKKSHVRQPTPSNPNKVSSKGDEAFVMGNGNKSDGAKLNNPFPSKSSQAKVQKPNPQPKESKAQQKKPTSTTSKTLEGSANPIPKPTEIKVPPKKAPAPTFKTADRPANVFHLLRQDSSCDTSQSDVEEINPVKVKSATENQKPQTLPQNSKADKKKVKKERQRLEAKQQQILRAQGDARQKMKDLLSKIEKESSQKNYAAAKKLVFQAFDMNPTQEEKIKLRKLRLKVFSAQKDHEAVLAETTSLLETSPEDTGCRTQFASSCLALGYIEKWKTFYDEYHCNSLRNFQTLFQKLEKLMSEVKSKENSKKYAEALFALNECLKISPNSAKLICWKVKLCCLTKDFSDAEIALKKLESNNQKVESSEESLMRGIYFYYKGKPEDAVSHFSKAQKENKEAEVWLKKISHMKNFSELMKYIFSSGQAGAKREAEVLKAYDNAVLIDPDHKEFTVEVYLKMASFYDTCARNNEKAIEYLDKLLKVNDSHAFALNMRGMLKLGLDQHEEAITDFRKALKISNDKTYLKNLKDAETLLRHKKEEAREKERQERRDAKARMKAALSSGESFYNILGVGREASQAEIKTAFKEKALALHPDKHSTEGEEVIREMEAKMKDVNRAYSCLSNSQSKAMYDAKLDRGSSDSDWSDYDSDCSDEECGPYCNCGGGGFYDLNDLLNMFMYEQMFRGRRGRGGRGFRPYWM